MIWSYDLVTLSLVLICAYCALQTTNALGGALFLSTFSFLMCLIWAEMGATDVAFTEAAVGAGVSTVFFVVTILRTTSRSSD